MSTVPAHSLSAPARALVMAAARVMPGVWGVSVSSSPDRTIRTPWARQSIGMVASISQHACLPAHRPSPPPGFDTVAAEPVDLAGGGAWAAVRLQGSIGKRAVGQLLAREG